MKLLILGVSVVLLALVGLFSSAYGQILCQPSTTDRMIDLLEGRGDPGPIPRPCGELERQRREHKQAKEAEERQKKILDCLEAISRGRTC